MGRCLRLGLDALGSSRSIWLDADFRAELRALVEDAEQFGNAREQLHARAVNSYAKGEFTRATELWERVLRQHPTDLMAVKFAHDAYFFKGDAPGKLRSVQGVLADWREDLPCFSYLFGMEAFALEENKRYEEGKKAANKVSGCWRWT